MARPSHDPGVEETAQLRAGRLLDERVELLARRRAVVQVTRPGAHPLPEGLVADLLAHLVPEQRAGVVDVGAAELLRVVVAGRTVGVAQLLVDRTPLRERGLQRLAPLLVVPDRLEVGRHPLAQPHVAPVLRRDLVAVPLVDELVHDHLR